MFSSSLITGKCLHTVGTLFYLDLASSFTGFSCVKGNSLLAEVERFLKAVNHRLLENSVDGFNHTG